MQQRIAAITLIAGALAGTHSAQAKQSAKIDWAAPLPSVAELKQRVIANVKQSQAEQERYICKSVQRNDLTDKHGSVKRSEQKQYDIFFVNGQEIDELTGKDGKPLDDNQKKKEAARVEKEIQKDSDQKYVSRQNQKEEQQLDMLLQMLRYTDGHRIDLAGRPTLAYKLSGDPDVHPHGMEETFLHDLSGTIQVDEQTGELVELDAQLDHDVKLGGGLLANLHKGFRLHVHQQRYPDGVWLPSLVEGTGDARAALLLHPYFRFRDTLAGCVRTSVTTAQSESLIRKN